ncbi:Hypothetical protein I595_1726 [Croceitalea dokdonensis DOKDO 023]|uniref:DoxX family protein n=1 Tax=Croceitalea dokdonensis DOKDO 023 TaxID=1300341 RepID=A0A0P7B1Z0_9FLAO|nr:DoxX family protein [Croceitalea dokdonensis]KPM32077.1 Hypothetical protein I595_1726 [Croceitalea dokdonensis DOKDO 023]
MKNKKIYYLERAAAFIAAIIFIQTLYFKFTGHPDSVHIFTEIGGEPYLRIGSGVIELIIALLLFYRKTSLIGAILGLGVMIGAIGQHLLVLGIVVNNDGGTLFILALVTFICCLIVIVIKRNVLMEYLKKVRS